MKKTIFIASILIILAFILSVTFFNKKRNPSNIDPNNNYSESDFDYKIIKKTNDLYKQNYMISPLSIGYALTMLKEGSDGNTKKEIEEVLKRYKLDNAFQIQNRVSIANLLFIRDKFKNDISNDYISLLQTKYSSDLIFDEFTTPKKANDWIKEKTFGMIPDAIGEISEDFVLGLANAIAIDVEWKYKFECNATMKDTFTKIDDTKMEVNMMHDTNTASYIESNKAKGIVKDYAIYDKTTGEIVYKENDNTVALEYIAILPNDSIDEYINEFDLKELNRLLDSKKEASAKLDIIYSIPRYTYDFDYDKFIDALTTLGIKDVFDQYKSNLTKMKNDNSDLQLFVKSAIHKSHIEFSENGTKAAAVTVMMTEGVTAMPEEMETIKIDFNRPFIYIIKEKNKDNIWFFGTVYEPDAYTGERNCKMPY